MKKPEFLLFAGPNGSGKSFLIGQLKKQGYIQNAIYLNADRIETQLKKSRRFSFNAYRVKVTEFDFKAYIFTSSLYIKISDKNALKWINIRSGVLNIDPSLELNSYHASLVTMYLAEKLLLSRQSIIFETVMSHRSKIDLLDLANRSGYKTYLYFVCVDHPLINVARVKLRVLQGGHNVDSQTIQARIPKTMGLFPDAFALAENAYLIDNSNEPLIIFRKEGPNIRFNNHFPMFLDSVNKRLREIYS